ncbi:MAG TPA: phage portal protein [Chryseolinea sp.]|nr:phage portal protein [Chryseolinea sp.]
MSEFWNSIRNISPLFFGSGRDQYTQTPFHNVWRSMIFNKGTEWVDVSNGNKFNLYNTTSCLKIVIDRKAMMKSNGQWKHKKWGKDKEGKIIIEEFKESPFVYRHENPNFIQDGNSYGVQASQQISIWGNNIQYVPKGNISGEPKMMFNLPAEYTTFDVTGKIYKQVSIDEVVEKYVLKNTNNGMDETFDVKDIIHFKDPHPSNPLIGLSRMEGLMMEISGIRGAKGFRLRIITANGALGILSSEISAAMGGMASIPLDRREQRKIDRAHQNRYGMQDGKADFIQTEAAVKFQHTAYPTGELMLFEEVVENMGLIIDAYGLNVHMFSLSATNTYENLKEGIKLAYTQTIIPEGEAEGLIYTKHYGMNPKTDGWLTRDYSHLEILKTDESPIIKARAEAAVGLLGAGVSSERVSELTGLELGKVKDMTPKAVPGAAGQV